MKGKYSVIVTNNKLRYEFVIKRNITVIRGDSATGKTTLINMLRQYTNLGESSGVEVSCAVRCRVLEGPDWELLLTRMHDTILFIDEENQFINTERFASAVKNSDNYFVLVTRENLYNLPYSVEEIYGIHTSGKYHDTKKYYQQLYRIYPIPEQNEIHPERLIVEDSNSGYEFFQQIARDYQIECESANGKSNICDLIDKNGAQNICVIADGAAIGPEMSHLANVTENNTHIHLYLPESFEWLILKSGLVEGDNLDRILARTEDYADSKEFFSWEQFYTKLLIMISQDTYLQYSKRKLNLNYLHEKSKERILKVIKGINFEKDKP